MSLDDAPAPTLRMMNGRLENVETAWAMAVRPDERKEINEEFKALKKRLRGRSQGRQRRGGKDKALAFGNVCCGREPRGSPSLGAETARAYLMVRRGAHVGIAGHR